MKREADLLGESAENYFARWKTAIKNAPLSDELRDSVLGAIDYHDYFGLGLIVITIPTQNDLSYYDGKLYVREGDDTVEATSAQQIASMAKRFM